MLETAASMVDVAMYTIKYIKRLTLTQVSNKVKSDFFRMLINYIKAQGNLVAFFIEPITTRLLELIDDDGFNQDAFLAYHLSMPNPQSSPSSELIQQKNTPLASNKSEVRMKPRLKQLQIFNDGSSKKSIPRQTSSHDEGVNVRNVAEKEVQSKKIRQAINYGFDRVKMLKYLRNNIGTPANQGFIPMGLPPFSEKLNGYSYKPEKARQLVLAAEIENGFDANKEIILSTTSSYLDLCEYIQNQLQDIGLKVRVEVSPASTHRQMVATSKLNFFRGSWIADYPDAENYLSLFYSKNFCPNGPNYTHFKNEVFDALYEKALSETNIETRHAYYQQMDSLIIESAVIVPLYYDRVLRFTNKIISGFESNAMNLLDLKRVRK